MQLVKISSKDYLGKIPKKVDIVSSLFNVSKSLFCNKKASLNGGSSFMLLLTFLTDISSPNVTFSTATASINTVRIDVTISTLVNYIIHNRNNVTSSFMANRIPFI